LGFVGVKMLITFAAEQFDWPSEGFHFPTFVSLGIIFGILAVTIVASMAADKRDPRTIEAHMPGHQTLAAKHDGHGPVPLESDGATVAGSVEAATPPSEGPPD
jgi:hypothetical protein